MRCKNTECYRTHFFFNMEVFSLARSFTTNLFTKYVQRSEFHKFLKHCVTFNLHAAANILNNGANAYFT